jgi:hypothetical protein
MRQLEERGAASPSACASLEYALAELLPNVNQSALGKVRERLRTLLNAPKPAGTAEA